LTRNVFSPRRENFTRYAFVSAAVVDNVSTLVLAGCSGSIELTAFFVRSANCAGRSVGTTMPGTTVVSNLPSATSVSRTPAKSRAQRKRNV
jgi:hypothetical protein